MFKCKLSSICSHTKSVCGGTIDSPLKDDEIICTEINCIDECTCLNYGNMKIDEEVNTIFNFELLCNH